MGKKLSDMSLEELWQLFPIFLTEHKECWEKWYEEELTLLQSKLPHDEIKRISHIGSTSIKTIWAKPTVDILIEVFAECNTSCIKDILVNNGYSCMCQSENRMSLCKGYTENGFAEKVYHLHLRYAGDNSELYFRDYLEEYPDIAKEYEKLKLKLWKKYEHNRDGYTDAKADFTMRYTEEAKQTYGDRYY